MLRIPKSPRKATPCRYTPVNHANLLAFSPSGLPGYTTDFDRFGVSF